MPYYTRPQSPMYHQITLEDLLSGKEDVGLVRTNETNTLTTFMENDCLDLFGADEVELCKHLLKKFVIDHESLYDADRHNLYRRFFIPKNSGGLREINAPVSSLSTALYELKAILEGPCKAMYHTSAFAYIKNRSTIDPVKRHQNNNSHWFLKVDFHDFFGSTTPEFALNTLKLIVPFNLICDSPESEEYLAKALDLCFLDGGLPQGTPISPMLTNLLMIPIDHALSKKLRDFNGQNFIYTRYADDMLISSLRDFKPQVIQELITEVLHEFNAPYTFKPEKTRYGSRAGSNWNLGVMLNKDNEITVGHKKKKQFRAMIHGYVMDKKNGVAWNKNDVQTLLGLLSYYRMVEQKYFDDLIEGLSNKYNIDIKASLKAELSI